MSTGGGKPDALEGRLRRSEHALLRAIPRRALRAIWEAQQIVPDGCGRFSTRQAADYLTNLLSSEPDGLGPHPRRCLLCHDRIEGSGGIRAHFGLKDGRGPRCAVFPAIVDIMRDCAAKRLEDRLERERWREAR